MDPVLITLLIAFLDNAAPIGALVKQAQGGTPPTAEQLKTARDTTQALLDQLHAMVPNDGGQELL